MKTSGDEIITAKQLRKLEAKEAIEFRDKHRESTEQTGRCPFTLESTEAENAKLRERLELANTLLGQAEAYHCPPGIAFRAQR